VIDDSTPNPSIFVTSHRFDSLFKLQYDPFTLAHQLSRAFCHLPNASRSHHSVSFVSFRCKSPSFKTAKKLDALKCGSQRDASISFQDRVPALVQAARALLSNLQVSIQSSFAASVSPRSLHFSSEITSVDREFWKLRSAIGKAFLQVPWPAPKEIDVKSLIAALQLRALCCRATRLDRNVSDTAIELMWIKVILQNYPSAMFRILSLCSTKRSRSGMRY
jgi:hypothetical protein